MYAIKTYARKSANGGRAAIAFTAPCTSIISFVSACWLRGESPDAPCERRPALPLPPYAPGELYPGELYPGAYRAGGEA